MELRQPNLFIIGAPKCGTTSLATWLGSHPDIFLSSVKEPHHYNTDSKQIYYPSREEYLALYTAGEQHRYRLDASVWYLHSQVAVSRIIEDCPNAKFIVCLRNPVDMAFSLHSQYLNKSGRETIKSFREAWDKSDERLAGKLISRLVTDPSYLAYKYSCQIGTQTERLLRSINKDQVKIVVLDDLLSEDRSTLASIIRFLDVDPAIPLQLPHENSGKSVKSPSLLRLRLSAQKLKNILGIKRTPSILSSAYTRLVGKQGKVHMSNADREIVTAHFHHEIQKIWSLAEKKYLHWLPAESRQEH